MVVILSLLQVEGPGKAILRKYGLFSSLIDRKEPAAMEDLGEGSVLGRGNNMYKGPGAGIKLAFGRIWKNPVWP